jgi:hypothetical protein
MSSLLEHYFVYDPGATFKSRHILKGTIAHEILLDLSRHMNPAIREPIIKFLLDAQKTIYTIYG